MTQTDFTPQLKSELQAQYKDVYKLSTRAGQPLSDAFCYIWLQTFGNNVKNTAKKVIEHLQWRIENQIGENSMIKEEEIQPILDTKVVLLQGVDQVGNGFLIARVGLHNPRIRTAETWRKYVIYCLEGVKRYMNKHGNPDGKITELHDMTGYSLTNSDLFGARILVDVLQSHYPSFLGKCYILNAPFIFWAIWEVLQTLLTTETREKIEFIYEEKGGLEILKEAIPENILPERYGGKAKEGDLVQAVQSL